MENESTPVASNSDLLSYAGARYIRRTQDVVVFLIAYYGLIHMNDTIRETMYDQVAKLPEDERKKLFTDQEWDVVKLMGEKSTRTMFGETVEDVMLEMVFCRSVDNYLGYVADLLAVIFQK